MPKPKTGGGIGTNQYKVRGQTRSRAVAPTLIHGQPPAAKAVSDSTADNQISYGDILDRLSGLELRRLAADPKTPGATLAKLIQHDYPLVSQAALSNPSLPLEVAIDHIDATIGVARLIDMVNRPDATPELFDKAFGVLPGLLTSTPGARNGREVLASAVGNPALSGEYRKAVECMLETDRQLSASEIKMLARLSWPIAHARAIVEPDIDIESARQIAQAESLGWTIYGSPLSVAFLDKPIPPAVQDAFLDAAQGSQQDIMGLTEVLSVSSEALLRMAGLWSHDAEGRQAITRQLQMRRDIPEHIRTAIALML